jgi:hypothetical protein
LRYIDGPLAVGVLRVDVMTGVSPDALPFGRYEVRGSATFGKPGRTLCDDETALTGSASPNTAAISATTIKTDNPR